MLTLEPRMAWLTAPETTRVTWGIYLDEDGEQTLEVPGWVGVMPHLQRHLLEELVGHIKNPNEIRRILASRLARSLRAGRSETSATCCAEPTSNEARCHFRDRGARPLQGTAASLAKLRARGDMQREIAPPAMPMPAPKRTKRARHHRRSRGHRRSLPLRAAVLERLGVNVGSFLGGRSS
jgi:hypothetical protein